MSLKARWLASMLGVVLVGAAITVLVSSRISFYGASRGAYEWMSSVHRNAIGGLHHGIFQRLEVQARLLARVPELVDAVAARRSSELKRELDSLAALEKGDFWAVVAEDGTLIATSQRSCSLEAVRGRPAPDAEPLRRVLLCGRVPAFTVTAPVMAGVSFQAWLVLGTLVDENYAAAYSTATGVEVVLVDREGALAGTFLDIEGRRVTPDLSAVPVASLWAAPAHFGKYRIGVPHYRGYRAGSEPLMVGESQFPSYVYSAPLFLDQPELPVRAVAIIPAEIMEIGAFYSTVILIACSLLLVALLGLIVWRLVNGFVRPIATLGTMTARVAEGDLECEVPVERKDELGQLSRDFNDMVRKLRESQRQLLHSEKMAAIGQLAAGVGHEINNPLSYVASNIGFAKESLAELCGAGEDAQPLAPQVAEMLQEVSQALAEAQDGADRVGRIVRELRTFARSEHKEERQPVSLRSVIETALKIVSSTLKHRAHVTWDFQETARVNANDARLVQVFINLLVNAAQAIPEGRAGENEIRITTAMGTNGSVVAEVADTGTGMTPEVLQRIFEPFFTTKPVGQGTGLGLSTSRNIIEGYGGSLTVRSAPGQGSTFRITLPAAQQEPVVSEAARLACGAWGPRGRVLVVDDEPLVGASAKRILGSLCDVIVATSARETLELVEAGQRFDLVLCDLMMPQMTGLELHEELQRRAPEVADRMLFLTGGSFTADMQRALPENRRIEKPFNKDSLRLCVSEWLQQSTSAAQ